MSIDEQKARRIINLEQIPYDENLNDERQKDKLLEYQEKNFEKAYLCQVKLNSIQKDQLEHNEQMYLQVTTENKNLKAQIVELRTQNRKLEDKLADIKARYEYYRNKAKNYEKKVKACQTTIASLTNHDSRKSSQEGGNLHAEEPVIGSNLDDYLLQESPDSSPVNYNKRESSEAYRTRASTELTIVPDKPSSIYLKFFHENEDALTYEFPPGSNENREIMSPVKLIAMANFDMDSDRPSIKKTTDSDEDIAKHLGLRDKGPKQMKRNLEVQIPTDSEQEDELTSALLEAENVDLLARSIPALNFVPIITLENETTAPKSIKNSSTKHSLNSTRHQQHHAGDKRHTSIFFVSNEEAKTERELTQKAISRSNSTKEKQPTSLKLFEHYFVIGIDRDDIVSFEQENPSAKLEYFKPKVLFSYPEPKEQMNVPPMSSVPDFSFPFGVEAKMHKLRSSEQLFEILFAKDRLEMNQNCFVFPLLSGDVDNKHILDNEVIKQGNPNRLFYQVCIKTTDYFVLDGTAEGKSNRYWKVEKVHCFMTYFPLIKLFMDLNIKILNAFKLERLKKYSPFLGNPELKQALSRPGNNDSIFKQIGGEWTKKYFETELSGYLHSLLVLSVPRFGTLIELESESVDKVSFQVCEKSQAFTMEAGWAGSLVFSYFPIKDLIYIFSAILLEKKLVILSDNLALLTSTLLVFYSLMKPFRYPFPLIFNLPDILLPLCDAPGTALIGINKDIDYLLNESLPDKYSECIFIVLSIDRINIFTNHSADSAVIEPHFNGFVDKIFEIYQEFNPIKARTIEYGLNGSFSKQSGTSASQARSKHLYNATHSEDIICMKIMKMFYETLHRFIIKHLPAEPVYSNKDKKVLDYDALMEPIMIKNPKDELFLASFLKTQIFAYFLELHYESS